MGNGGPNPNPSLNIRWHWVLLLIIDGKILISYKLFFCPVLCSKVSLKTTTWRSSLVVRWLGFSTLTVVAWVQSLVWELRSFKPRGMAKIKKIIWKENTMWKVVMHSASGAITVIEVWALPWNTLSDSSHNFSEPSLAFDAAALHWPQAGSFSLLKVTLMVPGLKWVTAQKKEGKMVLMTGGWKLWPALEGLLALFSAVAPSGCVWDCVKVLKFVKCISLLNVFVFPL